MDASKLAHTLVLDAGPIILNQPAVSTLIASADQIVTLPAIIDEIRDEAARSRLETTLKPFLTVRSPKPDSIKFVQTFARKTGDLPALSTNDLHLLSLAYEIELERNGGDWRLRNVPGQKRINGAPPVRDDATASHLPAQLENLNIQTNAPSEQARPLEAAESLSEDTEPAPEATVATEDALNTDSDSDSEGWITPSNLSKHQANDARSSTSQSSLPKPMQVATLTTDFAMQNVLLQIGLNLVSSSLHRIQHLKSFIKRCHACFMLVRDMDKQFCPRCGKDTLTKVACSTNSKGEFNLHLKKNFQWNNRGNVFSIPKPVAGSASGRHVDGGGKGGWGNHLILTEDQKEYVRAMGQEKRTKQRDLMDQDYLPSILTGDRPRTGARPKVGAGKNVNSRKRR